MYDWSALRWQWDRCALSFIMAVRLPFTFLPTSLCLITLANEWEEGLRGGRTDGGQVVGTDTCAHGTHKHTDSHTLISPVIQPAHGISTLFVTVLYLEFPTPFVCMWACVRPISSVGLWESVDRQTRSDAGLSCGKPTICWSVKGKSPHHRTRCVLYLPAFSTMSFGFAQHQVKKIYNYRFIIVFYLERIYFVCSLDIRKQWFKDQPYEIDR